LGIR
jgi:archaeal type IV pilus assembly protein PilA